MPTQTHGSVVTGRTGGPMTPQAAATVHNPGGIGAPESLFPHRGIPLELTHNVSAQAGNYTHFSGRAAHFTYKPQMHAVQKS